MLFASFLCFYPFLIPFATLDNQERKSYFISTNSAGFMPNCFWKHLEK